MRKKPCGAALLLFTLAIMAAVLPSAACAAEAPGVAIEVTLDLEGAPPEAPEGFSVNLRAQDPAFPMPEGSQGDLCTVSLPGRGGAVFPPMVFDRLGVYRYTIYQQAGSDPACTSDDTVYRLTVYVTNAEDGGGLETTAVLTAGSSGEKRSSAAFTNRYAPAPEPGPKTGDPARLWVYAALAAGSGVALILLLAVRARAKTS